MFFSRTICPGADGRTALPRSFRKGQKYPPKKMTRRHFIEIATLSLSADVLSGCHFGASENGFFAHSDLFIISCILLS